MANDKNAPAQTPPAPPAPSPSTSPAGIFGKIVFSHPGEKNKPFAYKDGRIQHTKADALVELGTSGAYLRGRVVAVQTPGLRQAAVEFKFVTTGSTQYRQPIIEFADQEAEDRMGLWRREAVKQFAVWYQANKANAVASRNATPMAADLVDLSDLGIS